MEVHHHSHTARKKWTHYFWEFLMLFLAVFCGFLAENQREHYVEKRRATSYSKILLDDLRKDTAEIRGSIRGHQEVYSYLDSTANILKYQRRKDGVPSTFYYYSRLATTVIIVSWNNATLNQLISSGNLRFFTNAELVSKMNQYISLATFIQTGSDRDQHYRDKSMEIRSKVLNANYYEPFSGIRMGDSVSDSLLHFVYPLQTNDESLLNEYINSFHNRKAIINNQIKRDLPRAIRLAEELMAMLKEEYHLE